MLMCIMIIDALSPYRFMNLSKVCMTCMTVEARKCLRHKRET